MYIYIYTYSPPAVRPATACPGCRLAGRLAGSGVGPAGRLAWPGLASGFRPAWLARPKIKIDFDPRSMLRLAVNVSLPYVSIFGVLWHPQLAINSQN